MTPIWLSYYIDGSRQELHADVPHGPWAFVISLTHDADHGSAFTGGETMILEPRVLDYWRTFSSSEVVELPSLMTLHAPKFNRLLAFDPRMPHGVRIVEGTRDPTRARIVLHGWFAEPAPFFEGALSEEQATDALQDALDPLFERLAELPLAIGVLTLRLHIDGTDGSVRNVEGPLTDTLVARPQTLAEHEDPAAVREEIWAAVLDAMSSARFPASADGGDSWITLPLVFDDGDQ
uniref:Fe2OG dioxygenase domain-containing protein n=2 Tax=Erythrolobus australicus TaxID=1077150 RepID=A0A7S1XJ81_9RHOD